MNTKIIAILALSAQLAVAATVEPPKRPVRPVEPAKVEVDPKTGRPVEVGSRPVNTEAKYNATREETRVEGKGNRPAEQALVRSAINEIAKGLGWEADVARTSELAKTNAVSADARVMFGTLERFISKKKAAGARLSAEESRLMEWAVESANRVRRQAEAGGLQPGKDVALHPLILVTLDNAFAENFVKDEAKLLFEIDEYIKKNSGGKFKSENEAIDAFMKERGITMKEVMEACGKQVI